MTNMTTLRALIAARHRDLADHAAANRAFFRKLGADGSPDPRPEADFVVDGVAHHVFNTLRSGSPSALDDAGNGDATFDDVLAIVREEVG